MTKKKHERIKAEIERMQKSDIDFCNMNGVHGEPFMAGKERVYTDLLKFINRL